MLRGASRCNYLQAEYLTDTHTHTPATDTAWLWSAGPVQRTSEAENGVDGERNENKQTNAP